MKKILFTSLLMLPFLLFAQSTEGIIRYVETMKLEIKLPPEMQQYASMIPSEEKTNMDLFFTTKESLYKKSEKVEEAESDPFAGDGVNVQKVMVGGGGNVITYFNLENGKGLQSEDLMGKKFLVTSKREKRDWKILSEQKEIAGYTCMKAIHKKTVQVLLLVHPQIPLAIGPNDSHGLPGAILQLDVDQRGADLSIVAKEILIQKLDKIIEKPTKGKKVTAEEFDAIVDKQMNEMREMHEGNDASASDGNVEIKVIRN